MESIMLSNPADECCVWSRIHRLFSLHPIRIECWYTRHHWARGNIKIFRLAIDKRRCVEWKAIKVEEKNVKNQHHEISLFGRGIATHFLWSCMANHNNKQSLNRIAITIRNLSLYAQADALFSVLSPSLRRLLGSCFASLFLSQWHIDELWIIQCVIKQLFKSKMKIKMVKLK